MDRTIPPPPPPPVASKRRGLLVAGLLLLVAPFLYANPWLGTPDAAWPWASLARAPLAGRVELVGLATVALGAVLAAFGLGGRPLVLAVVTVASFYAIRLHGEPGAFRLLAVEAFGLGGFAVAAVLGVGLLLLRRAEPPARAIGRTLVVAGAIWTATLWGACFSVVGRDVADRSLFEEFVARWPERIAAILGRGADAAGDRGRILAEGVVARMVPEVLTAVAVALGLVAAVRSRAAQGGRGTLLATMAFAALLGTWLVPSGAQLVDALRHAQGERAAAAFAAIADLVLPAGFGLFAVLVFAVAEVAAGAGAGAPADLGPAAPDPGPAARRVAFGVTLALGFASLATHFRPDGGLFAAEWPWAVLGRAAHGWDRLTAVLAADVVFVLCALAGVVARPDARVARALAMGFGVALLVVTSALARSTSTPFVYFRVSAFVPFLLAGVAAGAALGRPTRARRALGAIAAFVLLGLFFEPVAPLPPAPAAPGAPAASPMSLDAYHSIATVGLDSTSTVRGYFLDYEPRFGCPGTVFWLVLLGAVVLVAVARPSGRTGRGVVAVAFVVACAWPVVQSVVRASADRPGDVFGFALVALEYLVLAPAWAAGAVLALRPPGDTKFVYRT